VVAQRIGVLASVLSALAILALSACGGARTDTRPATDADFREVQLSEAGAARALPIATGAEATCEEACDAASDVCAAARAICGLARETEDLDLRARCRAAEDQCTEANGRSLGRCTCATAPR